MCHVRSRLPVVLMLSAALSLPVTAFAQTCFDEAVGKLTRGNHVTVVPREGPPVRGDISFIDRHERLLLLRPSDTPVKRIVTFRMDSISRIDYRSTDWTPAWALVGGLGGTMLGLGVASLLIDHEESVYPNSYSGDGYLVIGLAALGGAAGFLIGFIAPLTVRHPHSIICTEPGDYEPSR